MLLVGHQLIDSVVDIFPDRYLSFPVFYPHYLYCHPGCYDCYKSIFVPMHHYNHWVYKWLCSLSQSAIWKNSQVQTSELVLAGERCVAESSQYISVMFIEPKQQTVGRLWLQARDSKFTTHCISRTLRASSLTDFCQTKGKRDLKKINCF